MNDEQLRDQINQLIRDEIQEDINDYVDADVIYTDLMDIIHERSEDAYAEFQKATDLESKLRKK